MLFLGLAALSLAASSTLVLAQETPPAPEARSAAPRPAEPSFRPLADTTEKLSVTRHSVRIGGTEVRYTATAGTLLLKEENGKPRASLFFVAYTRDGVSDLARRPVTCTSAPSGRAACAWTTRARPCRRPAAWWTTPSRSSTSPTSSSSTR
jgi:carboxypeptidase C (cathepsin A)